MILLNYAKHLSFHFRVADIITCHFPSTHLKHQTVIITNVSLTTPAGQATEKQATTVNYNSVIHRNTKLPLKEN